jgi:5-methylcytosine-specific restriction endonuclease McrA
MRAGQVTPTMRVYNSKKWKAARLQAMHAADYVCQHPGCTEVLIGPGCCHVHHRRPLRQAMALAYEPLNHQALCPSHHSGETNREIAETKGKPERGCDIDGWPTSRSHPWFRN